MFRRKGTLVEWHDDRGYGFVQPAKGGERVFCHFKSFRDLGELRPQRGNVYTYELARDMGGRHRARLIRPDVPEAQPTSLLSSLLQRLAQLLHWPTRDGGRTT